MKNLIFKSIMTLSVSAISFTATAQNQNELAVSSAKYTNTEPVKAFDSNEPLKVASLNQASLYNAIIKVDDNEQSISINYSVPGNAHSAKVLVKDYNGRILKTFALISKGKASADFMINDLLSGVYNYILVIDEQKTRHGSFEVKD